MNKIEDRDFSEEELLEITKDYDTDAPTFDGRETKKDTVLKFIKEYFKALLCAFLLWTILMPIMIITHTVLKYFAV